ncbi:Rpn family recombination-promoting nuclease/putative transposase [Treponema pedis]|nr:Rpn family recombination-promoting nuclease/putative transposase [Treponema pedis]
MASTLYTLAQPEKFTVRNDYAFKRVFCTEKNKDILIKFFSLVT